jgi:arylsulfatase A
MEHCIVPYVGARQENQTRRDFLKAAVLATLGYGVSCTRKLTFSGPPNIVIIFLDDSGWADFRPFGRSEYATPHVQQLARQGCSFQQFYVPQAICSASRASLLTGCYPGRTRLFGAHDPGARGLDPKFATLGEVLQSHGYRTAVFGKWHIGDQPDTRPPSRGFDESCGLMVSNDMWRYHPENPEYWGQWPLTYWENGEIVIGDVSKEDQAKLTTWYTEHAVRFIEHNKNRSFFLYVPHTMPHVPLFCSDKFMGKSGGGLYADVLMEIDWSVGQIMHALKKQGVEKRTMVIFTSDNGPWISYGNHAGSTPFREAKGTSFDGGTRSACIIKYPSEIKPNSMSQRAFCSIDLLPTICTLTGAPLPQNEIDGKNVWPLIEGRQDIPNPHDYYAFSVINRLESILSSDGKWKLHLPHSYRTLVQAGMDGRAGQYCQSQVELSLFDLEKDPYETVNVITRHPEIAARLQRFAEAHIKKFYSETEE